jgi:ABC-type antimicrobial peptide transport system permease subunit
MQDLFERSSVNAIRTVGIIYDFATVLGIVLAVVGLYAVVSYQVSRRWREIGGRIALGAERTRVARTFVGQALMLSAGGISIGLAASVFASRVTERIEASAAPGPALLASPSLVLLAATCVGALIPARKEARIDPQQALRQD